MSWFNPKLSHYRSDKPLKEEADIRSIRTVGLFIILFTLAGLIKLFFSAQTLNPDHKKYLLFIVISSILPIVTGAGLLARKKFGCILFIILFGFEWMGLLGILGKLLLSFVNATPMNPEQRTALVLAAVFLIAILAFSAYGINLGYRKYWNDFN